MQTIRLLRQRADELEAQGHVAPIAGESLVLWRQADHLRAQAAAMEAACIQWRPKVAAMVHAAALQALYGEG